MKVAFRTRELERAYLEEREATRLWGPVAGRRYRQVVSAILRVGTRSDLFALRRLRLHPLTGERGGHYAMVITGRWRLHLAFVEEGVLVEEVSRHYGD